VISVVIPFYNELPSIKSLLKRIVTVLEKEDPEFEILIVDNGSQLDQHAGLKEEIDGKHIRVLSLSRNFGYQGALWAGLDHARGNPIIFMDADGEDPPELITQFLQKWREGYDVVYGIRTTRKVKWWLSVFYRIFYRMLRRWSKISIPLDAGEFSLVSGKAVNAMRSFQDRTRMMRIIRAWVGFRQIGVPYHREARTSGESKFTFFAAFAFAFDGFVSATDIPVRFSIYCALFCFSMGALGSLYYFIWYFVGREKIPGFASLNITILFLFSMLFICFGILARYVLTLLDETRRRPPYLVAEDTAGGTSL
jgi:polyisoprenyl-phosphate glycosyltransferase